MSTLNENQFKAQLRAGTADRIYYIYGNDTGRVSENTAALVRSVLGRDYDQYLQKFDGSAGSFDLSAFEDTVQMYPFGCEFNCILVNDWNAESRRADENKKMLSILKDELNDTTVLIFNVTGYDIFEGRTKLAASNKNKKIIDLIEKKGTVVLCNVKTEEECGKDISEAVRTAGSKITKENARRVAHYCLCRSEMIKNETDKLLAYAGTGEITAEMIDSLVTRREDMKLYELTNSILHGTVNNVLHDLRVLSESMEPEQIMYSLTDAYITWYRAKTAAESGVAAAEMQRDFDYRFPFVVTNAFKDSRKFGTKYLGKCIVTLRDAQLELNTMSGADRMTVIEKTLIKIMVRER